MSASFAIPSLIPEDYTVAIKGFIGKFNVAGRVRGIISKLNIILVQETVVEVERPKDKFFKKNKNKRKFNPVKRSELTGITNHCNYTDNQGQSSNNDNLQRMTYNQYAAISQGNRSGSIFEGSDGSFDSKISLNLTPSATFTEYNPNINHIDTINQSTSFSTLSHFTETDDHQSNSLKINMTNSNTLLASTSIKETKSHSPNIFAYSASGNGTPPALSSRLPIDDPTNYVTAFLPSPVISNSSYASDHSNLRKNKYIHRSSSKSTSSSCSSGSSVESDSLDDSFSFNHTEPPSDASIASVMSTADYEQFMAQAHDAHMDSYYRSFVAPRTNVSMRYSIRSTVPSFSRSESESNPSLVWSSISSVSNQTIDEVINSAAGQPDRDLVPNSISVSGSTNSNHRHPRSSREPRFANISETDEAVTPELGPVDTHDGDVIILEHDSMTIDDDGFINSASGRGFRGQIR